MKMFKYILISGLAIWLLYLTVSNFVDTRAYINLIVADLTQNGKKTCTKKIGKFNIEEKQQLANIITKANKQGYNTDAGRTIVIIVVPEGERVYLVYIWRDPSSFSSIENVEIGITEGDNLGTSVVDVCFTSDRVVLSEVRRVLDSLGMTVARNETLKVKFKYGIGSFIL